MEDDNPREYKRKIVSFKDFGRFKLSERRYDDDCHNIYTARLNDLREDTLRRAKLKWSKSCFCMLKVRSYLLHIIVSYIILLHIILFYFAHV